MKNSAMTIRDILESEIISGELSPGDSLEEVAMANRFNVSRTPVRESIQSLISDGLAERSRDRIARVKKFAPLTLIEMFSILALMDGEAAALAARRATDEQLQKMKEYQELCREAASRKDRAAYYAHNYDLHGAIRSSGGNTYLTNKATKLQRILSPYLRTQFWSKDRVKDSIAEHDLIIEQIANGAGPDARLSMTDHVEIKGEALLVMMAYIQEENGE